MPDLSTFVGKLAAARLGRRSVVAGAPKLAAGASALGAAAALAQRASGQAPPQPSGHSMHSSAIVPGATGGPGALDKLLYPPPPKPAQPGRIQEYPLVAQDTEIEIAKGVKYAAWTYNGTVPGPIIRATEGDRLIVDFKNEGSHPHTIHFHGIHPANMDGVFEVVNPGERFRYDFI